MEQEALKRMWRSVVDVLMEWMRGVRRDGVQGMLCGGGYSVLNTLLPKML